MLTRKNISIILVAAAAFGAGLWLRTLQPERVATDGSAWRPWAASTMVTLYFSDGEFFFPVSRRMTANDELPRVTLEALLAGPVATTGLKNWIPPGVEIRSFDLSEGVAQIDLSAAMLTDQTDRDAAETALVETMTSLPDVSSVALSVEGKPLGQAARRTPLLYYASANGLVAVPVTATSPRAALDMYLSGRPQKNLTALPPDVRLLMYDYNATDGLLSLEFTYTPSVRALAVDQPQRMRTVLLGLIVSLTEFPEVHTVRLDFEGQTRLGFGQCSDLLRTPQPRPRLLNDERLLQL